MTDSALKAVADLYHAFQTGLMLTISLKRGAKDAGAWTKALFRRQHKAKFLSSFEKLGLKDLSDAKAAAAYHYLSNKIGGVDVEYMAESESKAWVRFPPPRWIYPDASICGIPTEVSRGMLEGWYAENGPSLQNPRLGFVCTAQTPDAQHGLAGYFLDYGRELSADERLIFRPGELPPPFDPDKAPELPTEKWPQDRLDKAYRNYAMEYVRTGLPLLTELFGPSDGGHLGRHTGFLIGAQLYQKVMKSLSLTRYANGALGLATLIKTLGDAEGALTSASGDISNAQVQWDSWRLGRGMNLPHPAVFEAWHGLIEGLAASHDRFLIVELVASPATGDDHIEWRIRRRRINKKEGLNK